MVFSRRETAILLLGDLCILAFSLWVALTIRNLSFPALGYFLSNLVPFIPFFFLSLIVFYIAGLYEKQTRPIRRVMGVRILGAQAATVALAAILFFILPLSIAPKTILLLYLVVSVIGESLWRFYRMRREIEAGMRKEAILIGSGPIAQELYEEVSGNDRFRIRFSAFHNTHTLPTGSITDEARTAIARGVHTIVLDLADQAVSAELPHIYSLMSDTVYFVSLASLYEEVFDRVPLAHVSAEQLFESVSRRRTIYDSAKRLFDIKLVLLLTPIVVPLTLVAVCALLVSGGTPFITTERVGKGGRPFSLLKLRSMLLNDHGDPELQKKNRVTMLGKVLRKTRIDELPQLWNVLVGDLSFIGPRPELPNLTAVYEQEIPHYRMRHFIAPGLSGWAQIHDYDAPRGGADIPRTTRKLSFDLYYLRHRSFGLDIAIAMKTLRALVSFSGT
ncbi:MAG: sugar transferase [Patescibacteria group bacterium]